MKALILMLSIATVLLMAQAQEAPNPTSSTYVAPTPELFRDPFRKVKNDRGELVNADLRPLFTWFQKRRGERPMKIWIRTAVTTMENHPTGVLVSNNSDKKVFFLRNYPYKVPPGTVIQFFSVDSGFYSYKDSSGNENTVHAADYGIPYNPATEKKAAVRKEEAGKGTNAVPRTVK
jgi:hypothetical protein